MKCIINSWKISGVIRKRTAFRFSNVVCIIIICVSKLTAQTSISLVIDTEKGCKDVLVEARGDGEYAIKTTGKNPVFSFKEIKYKYDYKKTNYLTFDYRTTTGIADPKLFLGLALNLQPVLSRRLIPAEAFKTLRFNLKESKDWTKAFNNFLISLGSFEGKSITIKNIQLRQASAAELQEEPIYIDNGELRLGVDVTGGGSVFFFSESSSWRNLLNHADKGRFVQQSYYGIKDGSMWGKKPWSWNPVQGGGSEESGGHPAKVLDKKVTKNSIYIKSLPKHWATGEDITDATMEEEITLSGKLAHIIYTFRYNGNIEHPIKAQELPAVFVDYNLPNLVFYDGKKPWTNDTLTSVVPGWPNQPQKMTENWAAYVDDWQWGIGVYVPGTDAMTTYRHKGNLVGGPKGAACSYFAPVRKFSITPGFVFRYDVYLTIDKVDKMRQAFYKIKKDRSSKTFN